MVYGFSPSLLSVNFSLIVVVDFILDHSEILTVVKCPDSVTKLEFSTSARLFCLIMDVIFLQSIGGESPRAAVDPMSDVLLALNKQHFDRLCQWLNDVVAREGFPSTFVTQQQKETFCRKVVK